jgi:FkbM family methyltransferase
MKFTGKLASRFLRSAPPGDGDLYRICRRYVDRYNGENNDDMLTNGELRFMRQVLGNYHTVFDVGANVGEWTALALDINPNLNIHCFEPSKATYQQLIQKNFPPNVICNNTGLGSLQEHRTLYIFENGAGINSLYQRQGLEDGWGLAQPDRTESVSLDTLDHYCHEHKINNIDFLKIDVEGHELEVLKGAINMLSERRIASIQFEYGGCNIDARVLLKDLFAFFRPLKYNLYKIYPDELHLIKRYDQRWENFQYQNWVARRID